MSDATDAGTATTDAGVTQNDTTQTAGVQTEAKPGDAQQTAASTEPNADGAKTEVTETKVDDKPIEYEFAKPDGVDLDESRLGEFKSIAQELKLPKDAAQKVVDLAVKHEQARIEAHAAAVADWAKQVDTDKEIGSSEAKATARMAIDKFGTPELKAALEASGLGNHPELVRLAYRVGKAISEDKVIVGRGDAPATRDPASVLYPNQA